MLEAGLMIITLMVLSLIVQEKIRIPLPITLIVTVLLLAHFNIHPIDINDDGFDHLLLFLLPLLLMGDVMQLKTEDLKNNWLSVMSTAGIAVTLSVFVGVLLQPIMLPNYALSVPAMIALMTMVIATDPVTVASIFSTTKLPHKLKFLAESESLFNDVTAFAIFTIAITLMSQPMTTTEIITSFSLSTGGALITGMIVGIIGMYLLKLSDDPITETGILLIIAYSAFLIAEHFHFAGIFAIVVSMVLANSLINSDDSHSVTAQPHLADRQPRSQFSSRQSHKKNPPSNLPNFLSLKHLKATKKNRPVILGFIGFAALFANVILFVSISEMIDLTLLSLYWREILSVFVVTTFIRGVMMGQFAWVSNKTDKMQNITTDWWLILTFAGVKGGLSILMVHMIPGDFEFKTLFEAIVIGNIILSIFIYSPLMMLTIKLRQAHLMAKNPH
jgi:CPA1 family monovalent cation:H+ antiporter